MAGSCGCGAGPAGRPALPRGRAPGGAKAIYMLWLGCQSQHIVIDLVVKPLVAWA